MANREVIEAAAARGFSLEGTGGGCTALVAHVYAHEVMITADEDLSAPETLDSPCLVGFYGDEPLAPVLIAQIPFPTLRAALAAVAVTSTTTRA
jgi:hypothetical protein